MLSKRRGNNILISAVCAVLTFGFLTGAHACPIPVFQFSLEYWDADPYVIEVSHYGDLTEEEQELIDLLKEAREEKGTNISIRWRDYDGASTPVPEDLELPHIKLSYPSTSGIRGTLWEGPLEKETIEQLFDSPARQEVAENLLDRHAGVWVFLESGNRSEDRRVRQFLEEELERLENTLSIPDPADTPEMQDLGEIYTEIDFSMVTIDREDPAEQMFIKMLMGSERDLEEYADKPMVFPMYGRGLIMYALIGEGINEWTVSSAGEFLIGPCSCTVKQSNPGVDSLMSVDWEEQVERRTTYTTSGADTGGFIDRMDEAEERLRD